MPSTSNKTEPIEEVAVIDRPRCHLGHHRQPGYGLLSGWEENMKDEPRLNGALLPLLGGGAMAVCCAVPLLLASGVLSGLGTWLLDGAWIWLAAVPVLFASGIHLWRRTESRRRHEPANSTVVTDARPSPKRQK